MQYELKTTRQYEEFIDQYTKGAFSEFDMEPFIKDLKRLKPGQTYLEVGVDKGKSLILAFLAAKEGVNIVGVDIEDTPERQKAFKDLGLTKYVTFIHSNSQTADKVWNSPINMLFIDADHSYNGCLADILSWVKFVPKGGVVYFHDCDESSPGVVQAVREQFGDKVKLFKTPFKNTSIAKVKI